MNAPSRRDFMRLFGITVASLLLTRCRGVAATPTATCYAPLPPTDMPTPHVPSAARERLRLYWLGFGDLAQTTASGQNAENEIGQQMIAGHRLALDEMVAAREVSASVADLVQEAFAGALFHVWRSNIQATCYAPVMVDYAPSTAGALVQQSEVLNQIAAQGTIDPETLAKAQAALERDMAFYALSDADVQTLYERLIQESLANGEPIPSFDALQLELTPDAKAATQFIVELLTAR